MVEVGGETIPTTRLDEGTTTRSDGATKRANNTTIKVLEGSIDILAQHVQILTLGNERLRKALETKDSTVVPLRGGKPGPTLVQ